MLEGISAKTAALFGVAAGMALSIAAGFKPNVQLDMKVNFQSPQNKDESIEPMMIESVPGQVSEQNSPAKEPCPACGMG